MFANFMVMRTLSVLSRDRSKHSEKENIGSDCYWRSADRAAAGVQPRRMPWLPHHIFKVGLSIATFFKSISPILHDYYGTTLGAGL
jgi:hypothetical protein